MNAIERIKALKVKGGPFFSRQQNEINEKATNATVDEVLAILEEEKPVDPIKFAEWAVDSYVFVKPNTWTDFSTEYTTEQLLEIYKQTLK